MDLRERSEWSSSRRRAKWMLAGLLLLFALVLGIWTYTLPELMRLDRDEGINLMKSRLVTQGFQLYKEIWADQPPLYAYVMTGWAKAFGDNVASMRLLSVTMSTLALLSCGLLVQRWGGGGARASVCAMITILFMVGSRQYPKLSAAVMIGLPAVAMGLLGTLVTVLALHRRGGLRMVLLFVGGTLLALSLQTKLFTFMLLPMVAVVLWRAPGTKSDRLRFAGVWLAGLLLTTAALWPIWSPAWREQLLSPHLDVERVSIWHNIRLLLGRLSEDVLMAIAAVTLLIAGGKRVRAPAMPALAWLVTAILVLPHAQPLWPHHRVMFTFPLAMIVGVGLARFTQPHPWRKGIKVWVAAALAMGMLRTTVSMFDRQISATENVDERCFEVMVADADRANWVVSDDPQPVYVAGSMIPPEIAVLSAKRSWSGPSTEELIAQAVANRKPHLVYLRRYRYTTEFYESLLGDYELLIGEPKTPLYLYRLKAVADTGAVP